MLPPPVPHRKRVRHYDDPGHCHELTFSCYHRLPLLTNDVWRCLLSEAIERATTRHNFELVSFVYMPEDVHLIVYPRKNASGTDALLKAIKRPFSFRITKLLNDTWSPLLERLTIEQRPGIRTFRFWQEGPGYDRNLERPDAVLAAIDYIHSNSERRGLVARAIDWQWSSARWYESVQYEFGIRVPRLTRLPAEFLLEMHGKG